MTNTHTAHTTPTTAPADAWRDAWSDDREANRVAARMAESDRVANVDDRYTADDYRSALARCAAADA